MTLYHLVKVSRIILIGAFLSVGFFGIVYAASGFRLISIGGMDFASFFNDDASLIGIEADSFHEKANDTWFAHPLDGNNYLGGDTYFGVAGSNTGVITASGNVGIGTTIPLELINQTFLTINGPSRSGVRFRYGEVNGGDLWQNAENLNIRALTSSGNILFVTNVGTAERMRIAANGNVGIGTASPSTKLDIYDTASVPMFRIGTNEHALYAGAGTGATVPWIGSSTNSDLAIVTNSTMRMFIGSGGSVGIGTSSPISQLHISGSGEILAFGNGTKTYPSTPALGQGNFIGKSSTADYRIALQDGAGRVNHYWNAYYDTAAATHKYQVSSEAANRFMMSAGTFALYTAPSGTAGSGITWTTVLTTDLSGAVYMGTIKHPSSGDICIGNTCP